MACVGVALDLDARSVRALGESRGMLPLGNFGFLDHLRAFLVHFRCIFECKSEVSGCLDGEFYLGMVQIQHTELTSKEVDHCRSCPFLMIETGKDSGSLKEVVR